MTSEMNSHKPEWMEIAEGDDASAQVRKVSKKLPAVAVVVTGAIIATGAIFANASEEQNANAQVSQAQVSTTTSAGNESTATGTTITGATATPSSPASPSQPSTPGAIQNPKIDGSVQPQRGDDGDEDGENEHHGDRPAHDGERDGGEHHERA